MINEAYAVEHGDHSWVLNDLNQIRDNFAGNMEFVNLLALDIETVRNRIEQADVIFVVGGNADYLMKVFEETGFAKLLLKLLETKVYVGSSAGSMVLGKRASTEVYHRVYGEEEDYGVKKYLELVNFAIMPHLLNPLFPNNRKEILLEVTKNYQGQVYGIADDTAIVNGDKTQVIGSNPVNILDGKVV